MVYAPCVGSHVSVVPGTVGRDMNEKLRLQCATCPPRCTSKSRGVDTKPKSHTKSTLTDRLSPSRSFTGVEDHHNLHKCEQTLREAVVIAMGNKEEKQNKLPLAGRVWLRLPRAPSIATSSTTACVCHVLEHKTNHPLPLLAQQPSAFTRKPYSCLLCTFVDSNRDTHNMVSAHLLAYLLVSAQRPDRQVHHHSHPRSPIAEASVGRLDNRVSSPLMLSSNKTSASLAIVTVVIDCFTVVLLLSSHTSTKLEHIASPKVLFASGATRHCFTCLLS